jgi:hypothetical protein
MKRGVTICALSAQLGKDVYPVIAYYSVDA